MSEYVIDTSIMNIDRKAPITRCMDCDHFDEFSLLPGFSTPLCMLLNRMTDPMGFCAWGKPKEEA